MKQLLLLITLCCILAGTSQAATVSGTITNLGTSSPASGMVVYVSDTAGFYRDSSISDASGFYSVTLPGSLTSRVLTVSTYACGTAYTRTPFFNGVSNITENFNVCPGAFLIQGSVLLDSAFNNGLATVYLIRKSYDSTILDTTLTAIDSMTTAPSGGTFAKSYASIPSGTLLLKAVLDISHPYHASSLPTYYGDVLVWSLAPALSPTNFNGSASSNIKMVKGVNPGGPGFLGGSVLVGANKSTAVGDPLGNRLLLLTDGIGRAVAYTYSNVSGLFQFSGLAYGTYKIFGDAWGKTNPALTVTITPFRPSIANILFEENDKSFKGTVPGTGLSIAGQSALNSVRVYPNPVADYLHLEGLHFIAGSKSITLSDMSGALLLRQELAQGVDPELSTAALPAGIYILQLETEAGRAWYKVVK